jgi:RNA polymerase sigma-70 factor (ECF subfamily)
MTETTAATLDWSYTGATSPHANAGTPGKWRDSAKLRGAAQPALRRAKPARRPIVDDPDRALVKRWQAGDESAFEQLIRIHERRVFGMLYRMMGTREEAEDVAQETFLSLHRHGRNFRCEARFSTFVYRVAANAALNRRRSLGRSRTRVQRLEVSQAAGDDLPSAPRCPENATEGSEMTQQVQMALQRLTPSMRMPLVMYEMEGVSYGDIAKSLGVAEGTVKSRIHRARQVLRRELTPVVEEGGR